MESNIEVSFASHDAIEKLKHLSALYTPEDLFKGSDHTYRFYNKYANIRFNNLKKVPLLAPTRILHISNLKPTCSNYDTMWDIFSEFGIVEVSYKLNIYSGCKST
jgi:hypothetical protein